MINHFGFNPRARMGRDTSSMRRLPCRSSFNPRARMGRDKMKIKTHFHNGGFQSTRPHGARHRSRTQPSTPCRFNPRARKGRDEASNVVSSIKDAVSIHAPARGATKAFHGQLREISFQSTRPQGARLYRFQNIFRVLMSFNPRARKGRDLLVPLESMQLPCFNPRARKGRDLALSGKCATMRRVSIHAPARGATASTDAEFRITLVSIHAPAWGATKATLQQFRDMVVSIHAPAWGATMVVCLCPRLKACFNPRARMGRDQHFHHVCDGKQSFQSTRPHGARLGAAAIIRAAISFNPRARMGRDMYSIDINGISACFNPRARKGRDMNAQEDKREKDAVSIHAPARGATLRLSSSKTSHYVSIHAPARGATIYFLLLRGQSHVSIHAPARGATHSNNTNHRHI